MDSSMELVFGSFDRPVRSHDVVVKNNDDDDDDDSSSVVKSNTDTLSEVLMKQDPSNIFNCMLVSKHWLSVITTPCFWKDYLNKWEDSLSSKVLGFLLYDHSHHWEAERMAERMASPGVELLPTSHLGQNINASFTFPASLGLYISKSPRGGLLLLGGIDPKRYYVWKPTPGSPPVELPPPPVGYKACQANIISDDDDGAHYKVILGDTGRIGTDVEDSKVGVQTFCSRTWKWEQSTLTMPTPLCLGPASTADFGTATKRGVIYWRALKNRNLCLVAWDLNRGGISVIPYPPFMAVIPQQLPDFEITYGVSSQGSLLAATWGYDMFDPSFHWATWGYHWESEWMTINIWSLDADKGEWDSLHSVRHASIWTNNLPLLTSLFEAKPKNGFIFVSFVPGKSDAVFVALERQLFVYHFGTGKLDHVDCLKYGFKCDPNHVLGLVAYHPLTLYDMGIWLSPPPSLQLPH